MHTYKEIVLALKENIKPLIKKGLVAVSAIGTGSNGTAFSLKDGRILKITRDKREAVASLKIQGKKLKYAVKIFDVFKMKNSMNANVYGIVQERLDELSSQQKDELEVAFGVIDALLNVDVYERGWNFFLSKVQSIKDSDIEDILGVASKTDEPSFKPGDISLDDLYDAVKTIKRYNVDKMMDEILSHGIRFFDYTKDNIMRRGTQFVINDLGISETSAAGEPPVLESTKKVEPVDMTDVLLANKELLIKNNLRPIKTLGFGSRGEAFKLRDGGVLKVSSDKDEALASMKIMGKDIPGVVRVERVFKFPNSQVYGIVQEELLPLSSQEKAVLHSANKLVERLFDNNMDAYRWGWKQFINITDSKLRQSGLTSKDKEFIDIIKAVKVYKSFGLDKMMDGLYSSGVIFHDYHKGNIMKRRDGSYVVIDLGASHVEGVNEPDVLERKSIQETLSDVISVVYADMQPFSKKQSAEVRKLAIKGKVVLLLKAGEIPFNVMHDIIKASLPDIEGSVEVYDAAGGDIASVVSRIARKSPAIRAGVSVTVYSDDDSAVESLDSIGIEAIPGDIELSDEASMSKIKDETAIDGILDPHVFSDRKRANQIKSSLSKLNESLLNERYLTDIGGVEGAKQIVARNAEFLKKEFNVTVGSFIGNGEKGAVFDAGNNKVLKITSDVKDVSSATKLIDKNLKFVTHIFDAGELPPQPGIRIPVYAIVSDKVVPLPENEQDEFNRFFSEVRESPGQNKLLSLLAANKMDEFFDEFRKYTLEDLLKDAQSPKAKQRAYDAVEQKARGLWDVMRKYKIVDMVGELSSNGVLYADYKGDNLGKKGNNYVLLDVGGKSDGPPPRKLGQQK